jgi:glycosyltransferase involved in cell wall biosynthesis
VRVVLLGSGVLPIPPPGWGAVERAIDGLARALELQGVEVEIVQRSGKGRPRDEYRFALALPRMLRGKRWDVLHASTPVVANRLLLRHVPYVYTSHSRHWTGAQGLSQRWGFHLEKRACAGALRAVALTPEVADRTRRARPGTRVDRIRVIPNGVDLERFGPEWSVRHGQQVLGVGAVHPRKRWHLAVAALRDLPDLYLTIVGPIQDPAYARRLQELIGGPGRLNLTGEVSAEELRRRYASSDVLLHPSGSELLSISVLEALASALPVVGTSILSEEVPQGVAGVLVPETLADAPKVEAFKAALSSVLADDGRRHDLSLGARRIAEERYGWSAVARAVVAMYEELLNPVPPAPPPPAPDPPPPLPPPPNLPG